MLPLRNVGILYKTTHYLPQKALFMLYNSFILPYITYMYCNIVWAACANTKINSIYILQKKALRICTGSQFLAHTDPIFYELKTLKVHDLNSLQSLIFMFKYTNNLLPRSFQNFFTLNNTIHSYPMNSQFFKFSFGQSQNSYCSKVH